MSRHFYIQTGGGLDLRNAILVQGNGICRSEYCRQRRRDFRRKWRIRYPSTELQFAATQQFPSRRTLFAERNASYYEFVNHREFFGQLHRNFQSRLNGANLYMANVTVSGNFDSTPNNTGCGAICNNSGVLFIRNSTIFNNSATLAAADFERSQAEI